MSKISEQELYREIKEAADDIIFFDKIKEAKKLSDLVGKMLSENKTIDNIIADSYRTIYYQLRWICLNWLKEEEILGLLKNHLSEAFSLDNNVFNFWEKLKGYLLEIPDYEDRDRIKNIIRDILNKNQILLSSKKLSNGLSPTAENWIKIYVSKLGNQLVEKFNINQFFFDSPDYRNLNEEDRMRVRKFLEFYERIKRSSLTMEGIEDVVPIDSQEFKGMIINNEVIKTELNPKQKEFFQAILTAADQYEQKNTFRTIAPKKNGVSRQNENKSALEKMAIEEEIGEEKEIEDLKVHAGRFQPGSLERKAIEEEIRRLNSE